MSKPVKDNEVDEKFSLISPIISDLSQLSLAVAIGLFGILAISVGIDQVLQKHLGIWQLFSQETLWALLAKIILLLSYFGLVLLGAVCLLQHKIYSLLKEKYISEHWKDHIDDLRDILKISRILSYTVYPSVDDTGNLKRSYSIMIRLVLIPFLVISILLGLIIIVI